MSVIFLLLSSLVSGILGFAIGMIGILIASRAPSFWGPYLITVGGLHMVFASVAMLLVGGGLE